MFSFGVRLKEKYRLAFQNISEAIKMWYKMQISYILLDGIF